MHAFSLSNDPAELAALDRALTQRPRLVVGLCAAWCDTCAQFRSDFEALAAAQPASTFVWLDIEDDAEVVGDVDVDNFPTIAVFDADRLLHFGASLPQPGVVARLLTSLSPAHPPIAGDGAVQGLRERLLARKPASL